MAKVITFSRTFPSYHPRAGEPTYFVEKFYNSHYVDAFGERFFVPFEEDLIQLNKHLERNVCIEFLNSLLKNRIEKTGMKYHTIRTGHRFKAGDWFSPRVWGNDVNPKSGRSGPYHSKQIIIAPDIQVKQVWDIEVDGDGCIWIVADDTHQNPDVLQELATNDGLILDDLQAWFNKPMVGQIICWNENINY